MIPSIEPHAFYRAKGERVIAEYIVIDKAKLRTANIKHSLQSNKIATITNEMLQNNILEDYQQVMRLCKTYIADPEVFALCREIEQKIADIIQSRFLLWEHDRWLFDSNPLPLTINTEEPKCDQD